MKNRKFLLVVLLSIASAFSFFLPASAAVPPPDGFSINHSLIASNIPQGNVTPMVAAGYSHTVGLKSDGTVVAVGVNYYGQCDVGGWRGITQVATGGGGHSITMDGGYTVGLKTNGSVVAVGDNRYGQCDVGHWTDIVQIAAGRYHTVALKSNGTVVAMGPDRLQVLGVRDWTYIVQVAAGRIHTVGLKSDGTVVAVGFGYGQKDVGDWTDIVQVAAGRIHTVGLKSDGTVVAVGNNYYGQCNVSGWTDIVQISAGDGHTVGLKSDGTVVAMGSNTHGQCDISHWMDIVQVAAGRYHTVGLKSDGTVVATESDFRLGEWNLGITIITKHTLTVSSTVGGAVITPGEESFNYIAGAMIHLVAKPDAGYHFVNWTGSVGAIFNVNAATTIITMNDNHSITANFEKNPPVWLLIVGIIAVVVLAIFFFHERRTSQTPYSQ